MAMFARSSLLRQSLAASRSPLRQNVGVSQAVAFHASARKQILPPLPRKSEPRLLRRNSERLRETRQFSMRTLADCFDSVQRPLKEPVCSRPLPNLRTRPMFRLDLNGSTPDMS